MNQPVDLIRIFLIPPIERLADANYQKRVWLHKEGPEEDSFSECVEVFSEAYELFEQSEEENTLIETQKKALGYLHEMVDTFYQTLHEKDIINIERVLNHPQWHAIQAKAKEVLEFLLRIRK